MATPDYILQGCKTIPEGQPIQLPRGSAHRKSGRLASGAAQHAYQEEETGTWYQLTELIDPKTRRRTGYRLCEYIGADCPCAHGNGGGEG